MKKIVDVLRTVWQNILMNKNDMKPSEIQLNHTVFLYEKNNDVVEFYTVQVTEVHGDKIKGNKLVSGSDNRSGSGAGIRTFYFDGYIINKRGVLENRSMHNIALVEAGTAYTSRQARKRELQHAMA